VSYLVEMRIEKAFPGVHALKIGCSSIYAPAEVTGLDGRERRLGKVNLV